jgi:hypothetical protein
MPIWITRAATLTPLLCAAALGATGCGSSSTGTSSSANVASPAAGSTARTATPATSAAATPVPRGQASIGLASLRVCLRGQGIRLPQGQPGRQEGTGELPLGDRAVALPPGVTLRRYRVALKNCGAAGLAGAGSGGATRDGPLGNPAFKRAATTFVACMRAHGVNLPPPRFSGTGPVFNTTGVDMKSSRFTAALSACRSILGTAFGRGGSGTLGAH